jgi:hypothetical protein
MKIRTLVLGIIAGAGALAALAVPASAYVACNREGECWHTTDRYTYQPTFGITVHGDAWKWRGDRYRWREHDGGGRGYWRNGAWITF